MYLIQPGLTPAIGLMPAPNTASNALRFTTRNENPNLTFMGSGERRQPIILRPTTHRSTASSENQAHHLVKLLVYWFELRRLQSFIRHNWDSLGLGNVYQDKDFNGLARRFAQALDEQGLIDENLFEVIKREVLANLMLDMFSYDDMYLLALYNYKQYNLTDEVIINSQSPHDRAHGITNALVDQRLNPEMQAWIKEALIEAIAKLNK